MHHNSNMSDLSGAFELSSLYSSWQVMGDDARAFLHQQLSHDLLHLPPRQARWAVYCNAKGRVLTSALVQNNAQGMLLTLPREGAEPLINHLKKFILRAKCQFSLSPEHRLWGVWGRAYLPDALADQPWQTWTNPLTQETWIRWPDIQGQAPHAWCFSQSEPFSASCPLLTLSQYKWLQIRAARPWVDALHSDHFIPQMLNYESLEALHFQKGCYPGQEVIARTQFRGAVKRRLFRVQIQGPLPSWLSLFSFPDLSLQMHAPSDDQEEMPLWDYVYSPDQKNQIEALVIGPAKWANADDLPSALEVQLKAQQADKPLEPLLSLVLSMQIQGLPYPIVSI